MHIAIAERDDRIAFLRLRMILRTIRDETGSRKLRDNPISLDDAIDGIGNDFPNDFGGEIPLGENLASCAVPGRGPTPSKLICVQRAYRPRRSMSRTSPGRPS